jgi:hypothetical protein
MATFIIDCSSCEAKVAAEQCGYISIVQTRTTVAHGDAQTFDDAKAAAERAFDKL